MIERPVVLVLGAGASKPYGFPLGRDLLELVEEADPAELSGALWESHRHPVSSAGHIALFLEQLRGYNPPSIDAFLENKPHFHRAGKAIMAFYLVQCEIAANLRGDWYQYLVHDVLLSDGFDALSDNKLSIITYNYDRSFECYLLSVLTSGYDKSLEECAEKVRSIPIIHLHGQLGKVPQLDGEGRYYDHNTEERYLRLAAGGIHIVSDPNKHPEFAKARAALKKADDVIFLGFGYLRENVERLQLDQHRKESTRYYGTGVGLETEEQREYVQGLFPEVPGESRRRIAIDNSPNVLEFLKNHFRLLRQTT